MVTIQRATAGVIAAFALAGCVNPPPDADLIIMGGPIHTGLGVQAEAVAVRDGEIVFVGDDGGVQLRRGPNTTVIDLHDAALFPGFVDAHAHLFGIGERAVTLDLSDVTSISDLQAV